MIKWFRLSNGSYLNPNLVEYFSVKQTENKFKAQFYTSDNTYGVLFDRKADAENEIMRFLEKTSE